MDIYQNDRDMYDEEPKQPRRHSRGRGSVQFSRTIFQNVCVLCCTSIVLALTVKVILTLFS